MAYPTIPGAYGLQPINEIGGLPYAGSTRMVPILTGYNTSLYNGDVVQIAATGTLAASSMTAAVNQGVTQVAVPATIGVFVGCEYSSTNASGVPTGPIYGKNRYNYWAAGTNAQDAVGYVVDDPNTAFKSAVLAQAAGTANANSSTTIGYLSPAFLGTNVYYLAGNGGVAASGNSLAGVSASTPGSGNGAGNIRQSGTAQSTGTPFRVVQLVQESAVTVTTTGSCSGTALTVASTAGIQPGMQVIIPSATAGAGLAGFNTYVTAVTSATAITVSASITAASGSVVTFVGYPEVIVKWNFGYHGYTNAVSVA